MPIPIAEAIPSMTDRIETVMQDELADELADHASEEYPLPAPEDHAWVVGDEDVEDAFKHLGSPPIYGSIVYRPSEFMGRASGDGARESYNQTTQTAVGIVLKRPGGFALPERNGHRLTMRQWMHHRGEKYRGAILNVVTEYVPDGEIISQVDLMSAAVSPPIDQKTIVYREAVVVVEVTQHVEVNIPH
ncbi:MAG: hypothetical protein ACOCV2_13595 [Persicimonas sp.]